MILKMSELLWSVISAVFSINSGKILITFLILFLCNSVYSQNSQVIELSKQQSGLQLTAYDSNNIKLVSSVEKINFENLNTKSGSFAAMGVEGMFSPSDVGKPAIPVFSQLIEVPHGAEIEVLVNSYDIQIIDLNQIGVNNIIPTQASYSKSATLEEIIFEIDNLYYETDNFDNQEIVMTDIYGIMRGVQIGRIEVRPFSYNPAQNVLKVYNNLDFEINFVNADHAYTEFEKNRYFSPQYEGLFNRYLLNYQIPASKDPISNYNAPIKYVIVADPFFENTLQEFIEWKTIKGFNVIEAYTDQIGSTNTEIKAYLQGLYESATPEDPAPLYLLIIGDHSGDYSIPAFASTASTPSSNHVTDLYFVCFDGPNDFFPDMYYGRISATTEQQLQNALDKIIPYEKYTIPSGDFLDRAMLIAGTDANFAGSHGDATIYYAIDNYYNTNAGYSDVFAYYYSLSNGPYHYMYTQNNSAEASASVRSKFTEGVGFANYTAHCNWDRWGDPQVLNSHIPQFNNKDEYPFMIGNCCQSMRFNQDDAFGEILLYTQDAGAVGYIGASNNSYWNEDVYWGIGLTTINITTANATNHNYDNTGLGVYDGIWHTHGEPYEDWYYSGAQINVRGNLAVQASTTSYKKYYWEIYHLSGDPSLVPYNTKPEQLQMSYAIPMIGATSLEVNTEQYAYVAISQDGVLLDAKWSGNTNSVVLNFEALSGVPVTIVGTKQDRSPNINENITPISPEPPVADFSGSPTVIDQGETVAFTDLSQYAAQWEWDFGDGYASTQQNPNHTYNTDGVYTVSLTVTNSLGEDTEIKINYITVNPIPPSAGFSANLTYACFGNIQFNDESNLADSWFWDFGDGNISEEQNPEHIYTQSGIYTVSLTVTNNTGTDTHTEIDYITIELPDAPLVNDVQNCGSAEITLNADAEGTIKWYDQPVNGNLVHIGESLTDYFEETTTYYLNSTIETVLFGAKEDQTPGLSGGYFTSSVRHGLVFDANEPLVLKSVKVFSNEAKNRLIVIENAQQQIVDSVTVYIPEGEHRIELNLNIPAGTGMTIYGPEEPNLYREGETGSWWDPVDPLPYPYVVGELIEITNGTASSPLHYYYYFYDWEVVSPEECISAMAPVTVTIIPDPWFSFGEQVDYCGESFILDAGEGFVSYLWNGTPGSQTYLVSSSEIVNLEVEDIHGCTFQHEVVVNLFPPLFVEVESGHESYPGASDAFATAIVTGGTQPYHFQWCTGSQEETIAGLEAGEYYLTVTDQNNCYQEIIVNLELFSDPPIADFQANVTNGCDVLTVQFTDLSENNPTSWFWDFGDGFISFVQNPQYTYTSPGTYTVSLTVSNPGGDDQFQYVDYIVVGETPEIQMSMTYEEYYGANDGTATVSVITSGNYTLEWCIGANTETIEGLAAGLYCVTVVSDLNCVTSACVYVTEGEPTYLEPEANFTADVTVGCDSLLVNFTDLSLNYPVSWLWDFGDGNYSQEQNPLHTYSNPGVYDVSLHVTNPYGEDYMIKNNYISVGTKPVVTVNTIPPSGLNNNDGEASIIITGGTAPYYISWSTGETGETITNLLPGLYSVVVVDSNGCSDTQAFVLEWVSGFDINQIIFTVYPNPAENFINVEFINQLPEIIEIIDIKGRTVGSYIVENEFNTIDISGIVSGIYFIKIKGKNIEVIEKIIIK